MCVCWGGGEGGKEKKRGEGGEGGFFRAKNEITSANLAGPTMARSRTAFSETKGDNSLTSAAWETAKSAAGRMLPWRARNWR